MKVIYLPLLLSILASSILALEDACTSTMKITKLDYTFDKLNIQLDHTCPTSDKLGDYTQKILINGEEKTITEGSISDTIFKAEVDFDEFKNGNCASVVDGTNFVSTCEGKYQLLDTAKAV